MSTFNAVLDSCILFKAATSNLLLHACAEGLYRARWSVRIVGAARAHLETQGRWNALEQLPSRLDLARDPLVQGYEALEAGFPLTDAGDRHVAATAKKAEAHYLVTENLRHFDASEAQAAGFEVLHHDDFGVVLAGMNLAAVTRHIARTPADRFQRYLVNLGDEMPQTVDRLMTVLDAEA